MPPRYAYWTILVDDQPTAFRSGSQEDLMPTFKRLQERHASAKMMWWQNGKLWASRVDAQEAMLARGEIGRARDFKQRDRVPGERKPEWRPKDQRFAAGGREPRRSAQREGGREERGPSGKLDWKPKGEDVGPPRERRTKKPEWIPKSDVRPSEGEARGARRSAQREGGPKPERSEKPEWKPKGSFKPERPKFAADDRESRRSAKPEGGPDWKPKGDWKPRSPSAAKRPWSGKSSSPQAPRRSRSEKPEWRPKGSFKPEPSARPEWKPKTSSPQDLKTSGSEKRKWVPKAEYKKSLGIEAKKDKNWRPGGEHKDPRQKYKDAKKAKWGRFKQTVRKRWESKEGGKKKNE